MVATIAIVIGIASSGFLDWQPKEDLNKDLVTTWYKFMGDPTDLQQLKDNTKYEYVDGQACSGSDLICAVRYTGNAQSGAHPDAFSSSFKSRITSVYNGGSDADISEEN